MADEKNNLASLLEADIAGVEADSAASKSAEAGNKRERNLDLILDIPLRVTVELGRTKMVVSDLLNLGQGSVIELSKLAGEPMEVLVNDKLVARGEAVVVNEKFGVRLTDIISPAERVEQLK
ncbi:MAG: flagellar motor switch protein FliN [Bdellovibrionota bacterium]